VFAFCSDFSKCAKRRRIRKKKRRNLNETLGTRISKTAGAICVKFGMYLAGIFAANLVEFGAEISELHRCENQVLFLPVYILTVWRALAPWAARHATVCLDYTQSKISLLIHFVQDMITMLY